MTSTPQVSPVGPPNAKIMIVGEAPGQNEVATGKPFMGASGDFLNTLLSEIGLSRDDCYITNVCRVRPPRNDITAFYLKNTPKERIPGAEIIHGMELLHREISSVQPNVIVALGDTALWALTGERGITKWRGSQLLATHVGTKPLPRPVKVIPTYHPAAILRMWSWRAVSALDWKKIKEEAESAGYEEIRANFTVRPTFSDVVRTLDDLLSTASALTASEAIHEKRTPSITHHFDAGEGEKSDQLILAGDIETRSRHIACLGISWSEHDSICIPFMCVERDEGYWSEEEEIEIVQKLHKLFRHPNVGWLFQNGLYDYQFFKLYWKFLPRLHMDIMLAQHVCFAELPKGLDFQSSIFRKRHVYWKDEGKEFHKSIKTPEEEQKYWEYNCKDCVATYEIYKVHCTNLEKLHAWDQYNFLASLFIPVLKMELRGVKVNKSKKESLILELADASASRQEKLEYYIDQPLNIRSPKQMQEFFYGDLGLKPKKNRKTGKPSLDDEALTALGNNDPLLKPITTIIAELRSLGVFSSSFAKAQLSARDQRIRTSYNICGTDTYRFSSSKDIFGEGVNQQTIPKGNKQEL